MSEPTEPTSIQDTSPVEEKQSPEDNFDGTKDAGELPNEAKKKRNRRKPHNKKSKSENVAETNVADTATSLSELAIADESPSTKPAKNETGNNVELGAAPVGEDDQDRDGLANSDQKSKKKRQRNKKHGETRADAPKPQATSFQHASTDQVVRAHAAKEVSGNEVGTEKENEKKKPTRRSNRKKTNEPMVDAAVESEPNEATEESKKSPKKPASPRKKSSTGENLGQLMSGLKIEPQTGKAQIQSEKQKPAQTSGRQQQQHQGQFNHTPERQIHGRAQGQNRQSTGLGRGGQNQTPRQNGSNKNVFMPYYEPKVIQYLLEKRVLVQGSIRINQRNYKDAYVTDPDGISADILICDIPNRNRSLDGDIVAVELQSEAEWKVLNDQVIEAMETDDDVRKLINKLDGGKAEDVDGASPDQSDEDVVVEEIVEMKNGLQIRKLKIPKRIEVGLSAVRNMKKHRDSEKSISEERRTFSLELVKKLPNWEQYVQRTGKVVAIIEQMHSRKAAGHLSLFPDGNPNYAFFKPSDSRVPRMKIPRAECPPDFWQKTSNYATCLFVAQIVKWEMCNFAIGTLIQNLGEDSDLNNRTEAILIENEVDHSEFTEEVTRSLPEVPYVIPECEIKKRKDFRKECVFTIDPMTARDLDDAMSVEPLGNGRYRVGVHIADVSHFVRELTSVDEVARQRANSVYLVQLVVPMLPRVLCEDLCSLNPGVDRLTFSVEWILTEEGQIEDEWFGKSIIRSCAKLAYEDAQKMIDKPGEDLSNETLPPIESPWVAMDLNNKVNMLQKIAVNLRQKRVDSGALRIDQPKICFRLNKETWLPTSYFLYEHRHSNRLIEEFMLLANMSVARKLYSTFPQLALLRMHPKPQQISMEKLVKALRAYGIALDTNSSKSLQDSFNKFKEDSAKSNKSGKVWKPKVKHNEPQQEARKDNTPNDKTAEPEAMEVPSASAKAEPTIENIEGQNDEGTIASNVELTDAKIGEETKERIDSEPSKSSKSKKFLAIADLTKDEKVDWKYQTLMHLCAKPMKPAQYFCAKNKSLDACHHYALSVDLYTHFTSPIRRYPDIIVHRLLEAALDGSEPKMESKFVDSVCSQSNNKKYMAKKASEKSDEMFMSLFIKEVGPREVHAMVVQVLDKSIECLLLDMAITKRVYFDNHDQIKNYNFMTKKGKRIVVLKWKKDNKSSTQSGTGGVGDAGVEQKLELFSLVMVTLKSRDDFNFEAILHPPIVD